MSYAVVMAYVDVNGFQEHVVRIAATLFAKFNATLIGLSALAIHPPFLFEGAIIQQATEADIKAIVSILDAKENWFRSIAGAGCPAVEWRPVLDYPADALAREALILSSSGRAGGGAIPLDRSIPASRF